MARLMRAAIGTNNIDNCSRVCHSPTSFALRKSFGLSGATGSFTDIDHADAAILIGANPTEGHPVVGARIKQATLRGLQLVTIDPRRIELADYGVLHLVAAARHQRRRDARPQPRRAPRRAHRRGVHRRAHRGLRGARGAARRTTRPRRSRRSPGSRPPTSRQAAHIYGEARAPRILWGLGVTEHKYGSEVVQLICNLALMTGKVGTPGLGAAAAARPEQRPGLLRHGRAAGHLHRLPPRRRRGRPRSSFEEAWGVPLSREKGYTIPQMFDAAVDGRPEGDVDLRRGRRADRPRHRARRARARVARVPRLPGHLRERDDQVRRRDPAGVGVPREGRARSPTPSGASSSSRRRSTRPASAKTDFEIITTDLRARSATRWAGRRRADAHGRDRAR